MGKISVVLQWIEENIVWCIPLIVLILLVGIVLTFKLRGIQFSHLGESLKYMVTNNDTGSGEVSSFGALCISMAATLGTGKIVGVATAIAAGGPGALFWMIVAAIFGMATKYAEGFLAIRFRKIQNDGTIIGGPFTYIEEGLGKKWKWLAISFAIFGMVAGVFGIGTTTQMNSISESVISVFDPARQNTVNILGANIPVCSLVICVIVTIVSAFAVIGGISRISKFSVYLVPFMAIGYFLVCILIILFNITSIPAALEKIFTSAFSLKAGFGAAAGIGIMKAMHQGVSKGIFSNEAGLGSAPIALASAQTNNPVEEGLVCMSGTFIDTMVLCLTIGLGIVITGTYETSEGIDITINAFSNGLGISNMASAIIVMLSIITFAFTTIIGWNVYGEKCVAYLTNNNKKYIFIYKVVYILSVAITPLFSLSLIWTLSSIFNGLMALPNLIGIFGLRKIVSKETNDYFDNLKATKAKRNEEKRNLRKQKDKKDLKLNPNFVKQN